MKHDESRFLSYTERRGECLIWTGRIRKRYGTYGSTSAHRAAYQLWVGDIPDGLEIDHLCRNPVCVEPSHLEAVTRLENIRRRFTPYTSCVNGHPYDDLNTYWKPNGRRDCRQCIRDRVARYQLRRRSA